MAGSISVDFTVQVDSIAAGESAIISVKAAASSGALRTTLKVRRLSL
jgi:hypothetical protein